MKCQQICARDDVETFCLHCPHSIFIINQQVRCKHCHPPFTPSEEAAEPGIEARQPAPIAPWCPVDPHALLMEIFAGVETCGPAPSTATFSRRLWDDGKVPSPCC